MHGNEDMNPGHSAGVRFEDSLALLRRAQKGDDGALERLCETYLPSMRRWARGRLPRWARGLLDTDDLVQEALMHTLTKMTGFEPQRKVTLRAYLRQAVMNRVRDEVRKAGRTPETTDVPSREAHRGPSPLEEAVGQELAENYQAARDRLKPADRDAIIARVERGLSYGQVAEALGKPSVEAAQMTVSALSCGSLGR